MECKAAWEEIALNGISTFMDMAAIMEQWTSSGGGEHGTSAAFRHIQECSNPICVEIRERLEEIHYLLGPARKKCQTFTKRFQISVVRLGGRAEYELKINPAKKGEKIRRKRIKPLKEIITCKS